MLRTAFLSLALVSAPAFAAGHYFAEPESPPAASRFIAGDSVWQCGQESCVAAASRSRPAVVCAAAARELGKLRRFAVAGRGFDAAQLEACNRRAR